MTVFRVLGDHLISENEFAAKAPAIVRHVENAKAGGQPGPEIMLESGDPFAFKAPAVGGAESGFTPIKYGSPLLVDIRYAYSGNVGENSSILHGTGDIAVISGVKNWSAFKASARGLNWVAPKRGKRQLLAKPGALSDGCTLIAYQKAIATKQVQIGVELASASSGDPLTKVLGGAFTAAAGIPLFMPYAGALLAAGQIIPAVGKLLQAITEKRVQWQANEDLNFGIAGMNDADAGFRVIAHADPELERLRFDPAHGLVDADGHPYLGDQPYVVVAVDGASQTELENFTPMVASAEMLQRFKLSETGQSSGIDDLLDLMTIISDVKFRNEALGVKQKITADLSADEKKKLQDRYDALVKNIIKSELKP